MARARFKPNANFRTLKRKLSEMQRSRVKVGVMGSDKTGGDMSIVGIAAIHEFGSRKAGVPQRSFIFRTLLAKRDEVKERQTKLAKQLMDKGKISVGRALNVLGTWFASEIKKTITEGPGVPPPLASLTVLRKGSKRPLVDHGQLLGAITHKVEKK